MDTCGQRANLTIREHARVVCVNFLKHFRYIELLHCTHQEVEIREGKLHVLWVTHTVGRGLIKLLREAEGARYQDKKNCKFQWPKFCIHRLTLNWYTSLCVCVGTLTCPVVPAWWVCQSCEACGRALCGKWSRTEHSRVCWHSGVNQQKCPATCVQWLSRQLHTAVHSVDALLPVMHKKGTYKDTHTLIRRDCNTQCGCKKSCFSVTRTSWLFVYSRTLVLNKEAKTHKRATEWHCRMSLIINYNNNIYLFICLIYCYNKK